MKRARTVVRRSTRRASRQSRRVPALIRSIVFDFDSIPSVRDRYRREYDSHAPTHETASAVRRSTRAATRHRSFGAHRRAAEVWLWPARQPTGRRPNRRTTPRRTNTHFIIIQKYNLPRRSASPPRTESLDDGGHALASIEVPRRPRPLSPHPHHPTARASTNPNAVFSASRRSFLASARSLRARVSASCAACFRRRFSFAIPGDPVSLSSSNVASPKASVVDLCRAVVLPNAAFRARAALGRVGALRFFRFPPGINCVRRDVSSRQCVARERVSGVASRRAWRSSRVSRRSRRLSARAGVEIHRFVHSSISSTSSMATKKRVDASGGVSTPIATVDANEEDADVDALGRAVKRLNTGAERDAESAGTRRRGPSTRVNAMLRLLHLERGDGRGRGGERAGTERVMVDSRS